MEKNIECVFFVMSRVIVEKGIVFVLYFRLSLEKELKKNESKIVDVIV